MRRFVILLALTACGESAEERLERFRAEADIECWHHFCGDGPGWFPYKPTVSTEDGVACMNGALASGARAIAWWGEDDFAGYTTTNTYMFVVDHQVTVFTSYQFGEDPREVDELASCPGPFRVGPVFCGFYDGPRIIDVHAVTADGCR